MTYPPSLPAGKNLPDTEITSHLALASLMWEIINPLNQSQAVDNIAR